MGLNVDNLILSALREDISSEDVSTNAVMPERQEGIVNLLVKQDGIICGMHFHRKRRRRCKKRPENR